MAQLRDALAAIDAVHGDGLLPRVPVTIVSTARRRGTFRFDVTGGGPLGIEVHRSDAHKRLTLAHEVGHLLDYAAIGQPNRFETEARAPLFADWRRVILASAAVQVLLRLRTQPTGVHPPGTTGPVISDRYISYLTTDVELWARSYAQYIARRSGNAAMLGELETVRHRASRLYLPEQWDDDDFEPIAAAIDELLAQLGWRS